MKRRRLWMAVAATAIAGCQSNTDTIMPTAAESAPDMAATTVDSATRHVKLSVPNMT